MTAMTRLGGAAAILFALGPPVHAGALIWEPAQGTQITIVQAEPEQYRCGDRYYPKARFDNLPRGFCSASWQDLNDEDIPDEPGPPREPPPPPPPPPCGWECTD